MEVGRARRLKRVYKNSHLPLMSLCLLTVFIPGKIELNQYLICAPEVIPMSEYSKTEEMHIVTPRDTIIKESKPHISTCKKC